MSNIDIIGSNEYRAMIMVMHFHELGAVYHLMLVASLNLHHHHALTRTVLCVVTGNAGVWVFGQSEHWDVVTLATT